MALVKDNRSKTVNQPTSSAWSESEVNEIFDFIAKKSRNEHFPFDSKKLFTEFKAKSRSLRALPAMRQKVRQVLLYEPHRLEMFDFDTKVKMIYLLRVPIDNSHFTILKKIADVELDELNRIITYETRGGGLVLRHSWPNHALGNAPILRFLADFTKKQSRQMSIEELATEYKSATGDIRSISLLKNRFRCIKTRIHLSEQFDIPTRVRMLYGSKASVNKAFLTKLRRNAIIISDVTGRILKYEAIDGSLKLGEPSDSWWSKKRINSSHSNKEENNNKVKTKPVCGKITNRAELEPFGLKRKYVESIFDSGQNECISESEPDQDDCLNDIESRIERDHNYFPRRKQVRKKEDVLYDGPGNPPLPMIMEIKQEEEPEEQYYVNDMRNDIQSEPRPNNADDEQRVDEGIENNIDVDIICDTPLVPRLVHSFSRRIRVASNRSITPHLPTLSNSIAGSLENVTASPQLEMNSSVPDLQDENVSEFTSAKEYLKSLRCLVLTLDSPALSQIVQQIKHAIDEDKGEKVLMDDIILSLNTAFRMIRKKSSRVEYTDSSLSITKIITLLRSVLFNLDSPKTLQLQDKLRETAATLEGVDEKVPIKTVRLALETTIELATPQLL